jgi:hypothetical protein
MCKPMSALVALVIALLAAPSWAAAKTPSSLAILPAARPDCGGIEQPPCAPSITNTFSPGMTRGVYDFTATGDGRLVVDFDTVLTTFTLTVTVSHPTDPLPLDPNVFPPNTVCVKYPGKGSQCDQYDFTGSAGGPNHVPVKNVDYRRLITLTLSYDSFNTARNPAFGHAPGEVTTFTEDILTSYSVIPATSDPTMGGKTPGLSSVVALDEPLESSDTFCLKSPQENQTFTVGQQIEVEFQLFASGPCLNNSGTPLRDKTARLSVSTLDSSGNVIFPRLRNKEQGNKFHFDRKEGVNEFDLSTHKLVPGRYTITIFGSNFSPQSVDVNLIAGTDTDDDPD